MIIQNRRRVMGKKPKTIIEQLQDLGCLMWFPLKASGQLSDVIGGKTIVPNGNAIRWSTANSGFYYVIQALNNSKQGDVALDWTSADFPDSEWTAVMESRLYPTTSYAGNASFFRINNQYAIRGMALNSNGEATSAQSTWTDSNWHSTFIVNGKDVYIDGVFISELTTLLQEPWGYTNMTINTIGSYNNKRVPFRNVMIFNKALSAAEIAKVIQLIHK